MTLSIDHLCYLYSEDLKTKIPIEQLVVRVRKYNSNDKRGDRKDEVVQYRDGFDQLVNSVYIGRSCFMSGYKLYQSKWHNPFKVKDYGSAEKVCNLYRDYIMKSDLMKDLHELRGKLLMCWCHDVTKCHGYVLRELVNKL